MERAKWPLCIAPTGIFILSNATFAKVKHGIAYFIYLSPRFLQLIQKAYSLFTVLQNLDIAVD